MLDSVIIFRKQKFEKPVTESIITQTEREAVTKEQLKEDWLDPIVRNAIEIQVDLINLGFKIVSDDPKVSTDLAIINNNTDLEEFNDRLVRDTLIFGTSFVKLLLNKSGTKYVGLWNMDAIRTDFYRNQSGNIKLKPDGTPYAYIEQIPFGQTGKFKTMTDEQGRQGVIYTDERVVHFNFETLPGSLEGVSRLRSAHQLIRDKWVVERGIRQTSYYFTLPILKYKIGTKDRPLVSPDRIEEVANSLGTNKQISKFVMPWWEDVEILYPKEISNMSQNLEPFMEQLPSALGIPKCLLFETGKDAQKGALRQQIRIFVSRINKKRKKLVAFYNKEIFPRLASKNKWKSMPEMRFDPVTLEDIESIAERMKTYVGSGIIKPDEAKKAILTVEDII